MGTCYIGEVWEGKNTRVLTGYSLAMPKPLAMTSYNNKKTLGSIIQKSFLPLTWDQHWNLHKHRHHGKQPMPMPIITPLILKERQSIYAKTNLHHDALSKLFDRPLHGTIPNNPKANTRTNNQETQWPNKEVYCHNVSQHGVGLAI